MVTAHWQPSLLDAGRPGFDPEFRGLVRYPLDPNSWVDWLPGWVSGAAELMTDLLATANWEPQRQVHMYDRMVWEPRLRAHWDAADADLPPAIDGMRRALSARYGITFSSVLANLYRSGQDSVAWHADRVGRVLAEPLVGIVTLGQARPFRLRPRTGGGRRYTFEPAGGDLLVMGGRCQQDWLHTVPKGRLSGARISVTFRHGPP